LVSAAAFVQDNHRKAVNIYQKLPKGQYLSKFSQGERIWKQKIRGMKAFSSRRYRIISLQIDPIIQMGSQNLLGGKDNDIVFQKMLSSPLFIANAFTLKFPRSCWVIAVNDIIGGYLENDLECS
jgi:hypothetical protein